MAIAAPARDTTKALWENYYLARVPYMQTTSVEYMQQVGTYVTGEKDIDRALANQWVTTMLSIAKMIEYYNGGAQIKIVKQSDVKEIYSHISTHLEAWLNYLTHGVNIHNAPIDDLIAMDKFANEIYDHAKYHFTPDLINSVLVKQLASTSMFNASNFFTNIDLSKKSDEFTGITKINSFDDIPERESLSDYLKEHLYNLKRWK
jgi:hypothetical protein